MRLERLRDFGDVWLAWGLRRTLGLGELFELKCGLLLYDITSTYFEGEMEGCPLAKRGYSRDSRPDRPQVCIGLVVSQDGFPLGYEVFAGNRHDSTTVREIIAAVEKKYGRWARVWVMDRGMVSEDNLAFLREREGQYIVGTPKAMLRQFEQHLTDRDWTQAQEGVEVKLVAGPGGDETFILTRSADRFAKEHAMHEKFTARLEAGLQRLQTAAESRRLKDVALARERLGRLKQQNWRASHVFDVSIQRLDRPRGKQRIEVTWRQNARFAEWAELSQGCYLLRSNLTGGDVVLPAKTNAGVTKTIRLPCVTERDAAQAVLLHRLGLPLPRRLRRLDEVVQR